MTEVKTQARDYVKDVRLSDSAWSSVWSVQPDDGGATGAALSARDQRYAVKFFKLVDGVERNVEAEGVIWQHVSDVQGVVPLKCFLNRRVDDETTPACKYSDTVASMTYFTGGTLLQRIQSGDTVDARILSAWLLQCVRTVRTLHLQKSVTHGNLVSDNWLFTDDKRTALMLCDWLYAQYIPLDSSSTDTEVSAYVDDLFGLARLAARLGTADCTTKLRKGGPFPESVRAAMQKQWPVGLAVIDALHDVVRPIRVHRMRALLEKVFDKVEALLKTSL